MTVRAPKRHCKHHLSGEQKLALLISEARARDQCTVLIMQIHAVIIPQDIITFQLIKRLCLHVNESQTLLVTGVTKSPSLLANPLAERPTLPIGPDDVLQTLPTPRGQRLMETEHKPSRNRKVGYIVWYISCKIGTSFGELTHTSERTSEQNMCLRSHFSALVQRAFHHLD